MIHKIHDRLENLMFAIIQRIPERFIPPFAMNLIERYLDKRLNELKSQVIKCRWQEVELQKTVDKISNQQQG